MAHLETKPKEAIEPKSEPEPELMACPPVIDPVTLQRKLLCVNMPQLPKANGGVIYLSGPEECAPGNGSLAGTKI